MKFSFTPDELTWLHGVVDRLIHISAKSALPEVANKAAKMRYKFAPNALHVFLNTEERKALSRLVSHRLEALGPTSISTEYGLLTSLKGKLGK